MVSLTIFVVIFGLACRNGDNTEEKDVVECTEDACDEADCIDSPECSNTADTATEEVDPLDVDDDGDGFTENEGDCDDTNAGVYPEAVEVENNLDDNCNDVADEGTANFDDDGDGLSENEGDCDDSNVDVFPGADDSSVDGVDNNCDDVDGPDADEDGYADSSVGGSDCDDTDPTVWDAGGGSETCASTSCKTILQDGFAQAGDDGNYWINPDGTGAFEVYCDMTTDDGGWTMIAQGGIWDCSQMTENSSMKWDDSCTYLEYAKVQALVISVIMSVCKSQKRPLGTGPVQH